MNTNDEFGQLAAFQPPPSQPIAQQPPPPKLSTSPDFGDFLSTAPTVAPTQPLLMQTSPAQLLQPQPSADSLLLGDAEPAQPQKVCWQDVLISTGTHCTA